MPADANVTENVIKQLAKKLRLMEGFASLESAERFSRLLIGCYRFMRFTDSTRLAGELGEGQVVVVGDEGGHGPIEPKHEVVGPVLGPAEHLVQLLPDPPGPDRLDPAKIHRRLGGYPRPAMDPHLHHRGAE